MEESLTKLTNAVEVLNSRLESIEDELRITAVYGGGAQRVSGTRDRGDDVRELEVQWQGAASAAAGPAGGPPARSASITRRGPYGS